MKEFGNTALNAMRHGLRTGDYSSMVTPFLDYHAKGQHGRRDQMRAVADQVLRQNGEFPLSEELLDCILGSEFTVCYE